MRRYSWAMLLVATLLVAGGCARQLPEPTPKTTLDQTQQPTLPSPTQPPSDTPSMPQIGSNWHVLPEDVQDFRARFAVWVYGEGLPEDIGASQDTPYLAWTMEITRRPPAWRMVQVGVKTP